MPVDTWGFGLVVVSVGCFVIFLAAASTSKVMHIKNILLEPRRELSCINYLHYYFLVLCLFSWNDHACCHAKWAKGLDGNSLLIFPTMIANSVNGFVVSSC